MRGKSSGGRRVDPADDLAADDGLRLVDRDADDLPHHIHDLHDRRAHVSTVIRERTATAPFTMYTGSPFASMIASSVGSDPTVNAAVATSAGTSTTTTPTALAASSSSSCTDSPSSLA